LNIALPSELAPALAVPPVADAAAPPEVELAALSPSAYAIEDANAAASAAANTVLTFMGNLLWNIALVEP
jgi:hypothetical protein